MRKTLDSSVTLRPWYYFDYYIYVEEIIKILQNIIFSSFSLLMMLTEEKLLR